MTNEKMTTALEKQINAELYSSYLYYSMSSYFENQGLKGFASWMKIQTLEEMTHADKLRLYLLDRGKEVKMAAIDAPPFSWENPQAAFAQVLEHERKVTQMINALMDLALSQSDHATVQILQWFVAEQVEEEANAEEIMQQLRLIEGTPGGLFLMDQELGKRPSPFNQTAK